MQCAGIERIEGPFPKKPLDARGHWATMEELLEVVTFHLPRYENTVKTCKTNTGRVNPSDLTFATKFVAVYLLIKVNGSRPISVLDSGHG